MIYWSVRRNDDEEIHSERVEDGSTWHSIPLIVQVYDSGDRRKRSHEVRAGVYVEQDGTLTWDDDISWNFQHDVERVLEQDTGIKPIPVELMDWIDIENTPVYAKMMRAVEDAIEELY